MNLQVILPDGDVLTQLQMLNNEQGVSVCVRKVGEGETQNQSCHYHLSTAVPCMAHKGNIEMPLFMRSVFAQARTACIGLTIGIFFTAGASAAVNVYAPDALQRDFIASTTNQYEATVAPSPYFPGTYTLTIKAKKSDLVQPPKPINDATAFDQCMAYGFTDGMLWERENMKRDFSALRSSVMTTKSCGGYAMTQSTSIPTNLAYLSGCMMGYNVAESTMTARDGLPPFFNK